MSNLHNLLRTAPTIPPAPPPGVPDNSAMALLILRNPAAFDMPEDKRVVLVEAGKIITDMLLARNINNSKTTWIQQSLQKF